MCRFWVCFYILFLVLFSKAFDIQYETLEGSHEYIWQTCYGISERGIGALLSVHGDDNGIVLVPLLAPIQIIIIPIPHKEDQRQILEECKRVEKELTNLGFRVETDQREDLTPGAKFFYWDLRGVPFRLEIGSKDVQKDQVIVVRRDTLKKEAYRTEDLSSQLSLKLEQMTIELREKAWKWMRSKLYRVNSLEKASKLIKKRAGVIELSWCGADECGHKLETSINASLLGVPADIKEKVEGKCVVCNRKAAKIVRMAVAY